MSYLLDIPWGASRYMMMKYKGALRPRGGSLFLYRSSPLPDELKEFTTDDFTYARWLEDDILIKAGKKPIQTKKSKTIFKPRPHQLDGAKAIYKTHHLGQPGFLLADKTGVGKTLTGLSGVTAIAKKRGFTPKKKATLLVICPKGVIPVWRQTIHNYPVATAHLRILVTNYEQLRKLLTTPKSARQAKRQRTKNRAIARDGNPTVNWDFIIADEAHYLKNYGASTVSMLAANVAKLNKPYRKNQSPFVIYSTATPGSSPLNFAIMANIVGPLITDKESGRKVTPELWGPFLQKEGFAVKKGKVTYTWATVPWYGKNSKDPKERKKYEKAEKRSKEVQRIDAQKIGRGLMKPEAPFLMRSPKDIAGWPEQQMIPLPLALTREQRPVYLEAWTRFRKWLNMTPAGSDPKGALVENLRYRQKSSLLKVDSMIDQVADWVDQGFQVFLSVQFLETLEAYAEGFKKRGITTCEISGRNTNEREQERIKFQKGEAKVVLCTVVAGISLHTGETLPDGTKATSAQRITCLHDIRQNPLDSMQSAGRCHRDGENSICYLPYFEETVDMRVATSFANKTANLQLMTGAKREKAEELEDLFRDAAIEEEN